MTLAVLPTDCITVGGHWTGGKFVSRASYIGVLCDRRALQTLGRFNFRQFSISHVHPGLQGALPCGVDR
jgi:hypothetical protein